MTIATSLHPNYNALSAAWNKYRLTMDGGDEYIEAYMIRLSNREGNTDFAKRKLVSPIPGFATAALIDVKNAIFQRMDDIRRINGSASYQEVMTGLRGGVDLAYSTMNHFIGREVLPELIFLGKVGIYVDMPALPVNQTKIDAAQVHPYLYVFKTEQIRNWVYTTGKEGLEFDKLLLQETHENFDVDGLPETTGSTRYRFLERTEDGVTVKFFDEKGQMVTINGDLTTSFMTLETDKIPFVLMELERSMLTDIANHQIALLNMESADVTYSLKANFTFYTEQFSGRFGSDHLKGSEDSNETEGVEIEVGSIQGRRYAKGLDRPEFISPSSEPLEASMSKQKNLKDDIRALVNLALSAIRPKFSSAESKQYDERGLESGLSFLGLILEQAERQIAQIYSSYENDDKIATIHYPERYSLKTDSEKLKEAAAYAEQMATVPSNTFQKAVAKEISTTLLSSKVSTDELQTIMDEIDDAKWLSSDAESIHADIEIGLLSLNTGAEARGYEKDEPAKAAKDHAERIERIKAAQSTPDARGNPDESDNPGEGAKNEKVITQDAASSDRGSKAVRGEAN
ncbi:hypothetical protein LCGC14_1391940 [marine sediment metagenome]|uniref:DUF4055 domain-containing protein n=1 Tax=marine sediment metagenome TaxID=412755 RepID=A0A0F9KKK1_9ZZZZ